MRFAIAWGLGVIANSIHPFDIPQGIGFWVVLIICVVMDLAEYGQKAKQHDKV